MPLPLVTWDPAKKGSYAVLSQENRLIKTSYSSTSALATHGRSRGQFYFEAYSEYNGYYAGAGLGRDTATLNSYVGGPDSYGYVARGRYYHNGSYAYTTSYQYAPHTVMVAVDLDAGKLWFGLDGVWNNNGNPVTGANPVYADLIAGELYFPQASAYSSSQTGILGRFTAADCAYAPPDGFTAWADAPAEPAYLRGNAPLGLIAQENRNRRLSGQARLALTAAENVNRRLHGTAALTLATAQGVAFAPIGLGAKMVKVLDPLTQAPLLQYLQIWLHADPRALQISLQMDDAPAFEPTFTWENPNSGMPAVIKIAEAQLPSDGFTHYLTLSARQWAPDHQSPAAAYTFTAQLPAPVVPRPEWITARLLRQNSTELPDLVEIQWRAATAVRVVANLRQTNLPAFTAQLGIAGQDETTLRAEGIGMRFESLNNKPYPVYFGVAGVQGGRESPVRWIDAPLLIVAADGTPAKVSVPPTPDTDAGTYRKLSGHIRPGYYPYGFRDEIQADVLAALGALPPNGNDLMVQTIYRLFLKIKDVIRKGGTVTLDDFGAFGVSWTSARTTVNKVTGVETAIPAKRQPTFKPSLGYKVGVRSGEVLTDAEALLR